MKYLPLLLLLASYAFSQTLSAESGVALALPSPHGYPFYAMSFPVYLGIWSAKYEVGKCKWETDGNVVQMCTLHDRDWPTELRLHNTNDICGKGCSFDGFFDEGRPAIEYFTMPDGSTASKVSGALTGVFTSPYANGTYSAYLEFVTYPQTNGVDVNAPGTLMVEFQPNH